MKRMLHRIAWGMAGLLAVTVVALALLMLLVKPNDYRSPISQWVHAKTGITLTLGDLGWSFYPLLGFKAQQVGLVLRDQAPALTQVESLVVGVRLMPLLHREIDIDGIEIIGLQAHLLIDAKGNNNWQRLVQPDETTQKQSGQKPSVQNQSPQNPSPQKPSTSAEQDEASNLVPVHIAQVLIKSSSIHYEDARSGTNQQVDIESLQLQNVSFDDSFPVRLQAQARDNAGHALQITLNAEARANPARQQYSAHMLHIDTLIDGVLPKPVRIIASGDVNADLAADNAAINLVSLQIANFDASANLQLQSLKTLRWEGKLTVKRFDPRDFMNVLGLSLPMTADESVLKQVQLSAALKGSDQQAIADPLELTLDDTNLSGRVAITDFSRHAADIKLKLDAIDVDRYLPASQVDPTKTATLPDNNAGNSSGATDMPVVKPDDSGASSELLPVAMLRSLNIKGDLSIDKLVLKKIAWQDLTIRLRAIEGRVGLDELSARLLDGSLNGNATIDVSGQKPQLAAQLALKDLQLDALLSNWMKQPVISGRAALNVDIKSQGNDRTAVLQQALGQMQLQLGDGILHGVNLDQVIVDALKQKLGDVTALVPDYQTRLPTVLKRDTALRDLQANMTLQNGHLVTPAMSAHSDAGQLNASGDIDLVAQSLDYRFGLKLSSLDDNRYLKGTEWPVQCKGQWDTPAKDWCRPDSKAIAVIVERAAGQALSDKATEKAAEKLGIPGADKAEVKAAIKQKAEEKLGKQLDKWLKGNKKNAAKTPVYSPAP